MRKSQAEECADAIQRDLGPPTHEPQDDDFCTCDVRATLRTRKKKSSILEIVCSFQDSEDEEASTSHSVMHNNGKATRGDLDLDLCEHCQAVLAATNRVIEFLSRELIARQAALESDLELAGWQRYLADLDPAAARELLETKVAESQATTSHAGKGKRKGKGKSVRGAVTAAELACCLDPGEVFVTGMARCVPDSHEGKFVLYVPEDEYLARKARKSETTRLSAVCAGAGAGQRTQRVPAAKSKDFCYTDAAGMEAIF